MRNTLIALACGLLFGIGLTWSGMASPAKVLGFLNFAPGWDPSLMFVMGGALAVSLPGFWLMRKRGRPLFEERFNEPAARQIDARLVAGAAIFGLGWGFSGFCPGPAIVSFGLLQGAALLFLPAMIAGALLAKLTLRLQD